MIDSLVKDLDTEMTEAETEEKLAQEEYEELMADSAQKRAADSKSITVKEGEKADTETALSEQTRRLPRRDPASCGFQFLEVGIACVFLPFRLRGHQYDQFTQPLHPTTFT